jgi:hypothetical protein
MNSTNNAHASSGCWPTRRMSKRRALMAMFITLILYCVIAISAIAYATSLDDEFVPGQMSSKIEMDEQGATVKLTSNRPSSCPVAIQNAIGLYSNKRQSDFSNVVLLTASNDDYMDMLRNWESLAGRLHLKWAVLALDDEIYQKLGPARAVPTSSSNHSVSGGVEFRSAGFNILSCNKMRSVLSILEDCQVDVIFSDVDNVFFHDPLQHDLGDLVKSGAYDYIYQVNERQFLPSKSPRSHPCLAKGQLAREGNTGFYFMSWKSQTMKSVIAETLSTCTHPENKLDDQTLFWRALHRVEKGSWQHCQVNASAPSAISLPRKDGGNVSLCCLDPFYYPVGMGSAADPNDLISFHANYVRGKEKKILKLINARPKDHLGWQPAIADYVGTVKDGQYKNRTCSSEPNLDVAMECLRKTTSDITLKYPDDADEHFNEIRIAMARYAQHADHKMHSAAGYSGPWIENNWISHFERLYDQGNECLSNIFGPFVPIFVPWVDTYVSSRFKYPPEMVGAIRKVLRPNVPYVTVSQNDEGIHGILPAIDFPNVLVLSAGGYGHVPVPLLKQPETINNGKDVANRTHFSSFVGTLRNVRKRMHDALSSKGGEGFYKYYRGDNWRSVMADSRLQMVPRGFGEF